MRLIRDMAQEADVTVDSVRLGKKHYVVFVSSGWKKGVVTISATASDRRARKNIIANMRRVVR